MEYLNTLAIILAGGSKAFRTIKNNPARPAVVFGEKFRVIDFVLSNLIGSSLERVAVLVQPEPQQTDTQTRRHELIGAYLQKLPNLQIWEPSLQRIGQTSYTGTADAVYQNSAAIARENCESTLIVAGDHLYRQDYRDLLRYHQETGADLTISITSVSPQDCQRYGMLSLDKDQRITQFIEKPDHSDSSLASMGIYVFKTSVLLDVLKADAQNPASRHDFGRDILPSMIASQRVFAYHFNGSWSDIATFE